MHSFLEECVELAAAQRLQVEPQTPARQRLVLPRENGEELFSLVATVMLED